MEIPESLRKFVKDTIERAKVVDFPSQDPFRAFGFTGDPFNRPADVAEIERLVSRGVIDINMGKTITLIYDLLNSRKKKMNLDGVLFSHSHSGTSTLIENAFFLMKKEVDELNSTVFIDAKEEVVFENQQYQATTSTQNIINTVAEYDISEEDIPLVIIDHADYLVDFFIYFRESFKYRFPQTSILFVFSYSAWVRLRSYITLMEYTDNFYNSSLPAIELNPLDTQDIKEILVTKLSKDGRIQQPYSNEVLEAISELSLFSLKNAVKLCRTICKACFYSGNDRAYIEMVNDLAVLMNFNSIKEFEEIIVEEDSTRVFLLTLITMKSIAYDLGITYDELQENLNLQKTTISYHLSQLLKKKIITKRTIDRKAYYRLNDYLRTVADMYLLTEFNKKDRRVKLEHLSRE
ncbi:MAG: hypothetical protein ACTSQE_06295 [Candidatus Heimdallarchaeaceae archaeon]